jgi:hypothetical protein
VGQLPIGRRAGGIARVAGGRLRSSHRLIGKAGATPARHGSAFTSKIRPSAYALRSSTSSNVHTGATTNSR